MVDECRKTGNFWDHAGLFHAFCIGEVLCASE